VGDDEAIVIINTDRLDRDREVVVPSGGRFDDYRRNRVVMFGHSKGNPSDGDAAFPVAKNIWIKPTEDGRGLIARHQFNTKLELGQKVCQQVKDNFLSSHSIKFLPIRWGPPTRAEIQKNPSWADAKTVYREWSLLEYSVLVFPANPDAITLVKGARSMGDVLDHEPVKFAKELVQEASEFVASQEEASEMIARSCTSETIFKGFLDHAEAKGEKLGDVRVAMLRPIVDALTSSLNSYLWSVIYDWREEPGSYSDKIGAACTEFCEAAITAFEAFEPLKIQDEKNLKMEALVKGMSLESIDLFGDPAQILADGLAEAMESKEVDEGDAVERAQSVVEEEEEEDGDEGPPIKPGDHVKCMASHVKGYAKCMSVHTKEMVPDVEDDIMGSKEDPAVRVKMYKKMGDGYTPTAHHRGLKMADCKKTEPLKPPSKAKALETKEDLSSWNDSDMAVAVEMIRSTPEHKKAMEVAVLDQIAVMLGRV
jgi:hypothetical protein